MLSSDLSMFSDDFLSKSTPGSLGGSTPVGAPSHGASNLGPIGSTPVAMASGVDLSYAEAFPPLPTAAPAGVNNGSEAVLPMSPSSRGGAQWGKKMSVRSSTTTQVFSVPVEERRYREMTEQQFGERGREQAKICTEIMNKTGVTIEMSLAKDQSLTVVVSGKNDAVLMAKKLIVQHLQTQSKSSIHVPKEHHRFVFGPKGQKLQELELLTATKITVPKPGDPSDIISITGTRDGIDRARHEIQLISDEQAKLAFERLPIPKIYHPFICGPDNQNIKDLSEQTGARITVPPHSVLKDEIVISGEKDGVQQAKNYILAVYEEKKRKCTTVSVEVKKSQHRYVIGGKGSGLMEILASTGVSVEVPPSDNVSETITLRGDPDKLGPALTMVYSRANSIDTRTVEAPSWLHRFIIGRQGANVKRITSEYPRVHIEFTDEQDQVRLEGPPEDVEQATKMLEDITTDLVKNMAFVELTIDPKFHRHIVGRNGANIIRMKTEHGVDVRIPADTDHSPVVRIEGSPDGVARAKTELLELVEKMENEKSRDIVIEQRLHRAIIGAQGARIREIREHFPTVVIAIPDYTKKSDIITLRGPKNDVDKCYTYLHKLCQELMSTNIQNEVRVNRKCYRDVITALRKIREENNVRVDIPTECNDINILTITGAKDSVVKAKEQIDAVIKSLEKITEVTIEIPHEMHNSLVGARGNIIRAVSQECGGVLIRFPAANTRSNTVLIRGLTDDVEKAKGLLLDLANDTNTSNMSAEIRASPELHRFLIGKNGSHVRDLYDRTGARVVFPSGQEQDQDLILIIGKQDAVSKAKAELEIRIKELANVVEIELTVDPKFHRHFVGRKGELLRQISDEMGGVIVSFPRYGVKSDKVLLKGAAQCVDAAKQRILDIVKSLESQVSVECVIASKHHRTLMGYRGCHVQDISHQYNVNIKFPDRNNSEVREGEEGGATSAGAVVNGDETAAGGSEAERIKRQDTIIITGQPADCDAAREALLALTPVTEELEVAADYHRFIVGQKGRDVRRLMDEFDVNIIVPSVEDTSDILRIIGSPENVAKAKTAIQQRMAELDKINEQKALRSFRLEMTVEPRFHPKIIGRRGAVVNKIRQDHDVQIMFPDKTSETPDVLTIVGIEDNTRAARDDILKIVHELEDLVIENVSIDSRVHSRIIGSRGRGIHRIMDDFHVDVRFPGRDADDPSVVSITGTEDAVIECRDHLLNLEEEYLQDVTEREQYRDAEPSSGPARHGSSTEADDGFSVRGAPWSAEVPDTSSMDDFPDLAAFGATGSQGRSVKWGPRR